MKKYVKADKRYDFYFKGPFWIVTPSIDQMHKGNFKLIGDKYLVNYDGEFVDDVTSKRSKTHTQLWKRLREENTELPESPTYYPRGRVEVFNGKAYIHINNHCNTPEIIDAIITEYQIDKLEKEVELNDVTQGSHYSFELR